MARNSYTREGVLAGVLLMVLLVWASGWSPEHGAVAVFVLIEGALLAIIGGLFGSSYKRGPDHD